LARGDDILGSIDFEASARHAVQLVPKVAALLEQASLRPADIDELYVSAGPGSFTGVRVGLTVARTMGQMISSLRCVGVATPVAVALQAEDLPWDRLAVVLDAREECLHVSEFVRTDGRIVPRGVQMVGFDEFLAGVERPITLTGEGLSYYDCAGPDISIAPPKLYFPTPQAIWRVGRQMASEGQFTEYNKLTPIYAREPQVLRTED